MPLEWIMSTTLRRCFAALLLIGLGLFWAVPTHATNITCTTSMGALSFGTVSPLLSQTSASAQLTYTCSNSSSTTYSAALCFSIGEPGGNQTNPRQMKRSTSNNYLNFQLYQDPAYSIVWGSAYFGSNTPLMVKVTVTKGAPVSGSATLYGQVLAGQTTARTGNYSDDYQNGDTALAINEVSGSGPPGSCAGAVQQTSYFPFNVTATVANVCAVSAGATLNFGTVASTATNLSGSNTITVACPTGTAYYVGLAPSNGDMAGAGTMKGTGSNPDQVPYQLRSASGMNGKIWGNTATSTQVGNGVAGNGNGSGQSLTVYATTPSANFTPDTYTDTVTINVNY